MKILDSAHTLVIGGRLAQVDLAHRKARAGKQVLLVEAGTFLGGELTRCHRPWVVWQEAQRAFYEAWLPIKPGERFKEGEIIPLHLDNLKLKLEDRPLQAGVRILYGAKVVQVINRQDGLLAVLGHKGGLVGVKVEEVIREASPEAKGPYLWTVDFTETVNAAPEYAVPEKLGVVGNRVRVYPGAHSPGHVLVEVPLMEPSPVGLGKVLAVAEYLLQTEAAFQSAKLGLCSLEPWPCAVRPPQKDKAPTVAWEGMEVPVLAEAQVVVVGGGTSGATAARVAAEQGARTILIEPNPRLGGTGTIGGVNRYWFGRRCGYTAQIDSRVQAYSQRLKISPERLFWSEHDCWHQEVKAWVLLEMCLDAGVEVVFGCTAVGTIKEGKVVQAVICAGPEDIFAVKADTVIDATGDGDVAVSAGAKAVYGNERDAFTLWYFLAPYYAPGKSKNNFTNTVHVGDVEDYTRAILVGRRRGFPQCWDHGSYLAPRESRHIVGDITLTLEDQLLLRKFPDTVNICFSNHDPKGISTADSILCGLLPPHLEVEIPYRALLPQGLDNLLVVGKAISADHDAFAAIRMQADLQNLGGAAGLAAALAVHGSTSVREIPLRRLQEILIEMGVLPDVVLRRELQPREDVHPELLMQAVSPDEPWEWLEMDMTEAAKHVPVIAQLMFAQSQAVVPALRRAHAAAQGNLRLNLARLLAWHRDSSGLEDLVGEIRRLFSENPPLPRRQGSTRFATSPPDHGVMPEACYLLYTLGRLGDKRAFPVFAELTERIIQAERDYQDIRAGIFHYVDCIAYAAEHMAEPEFIPLLAKLSTLPELQNCVATAGIEVDPLKERLAYLSLRIHRARARLGVKEGLQRIEEFTKDSRALLRESALRELTVLQGNKPQ